VVGDNGKGAAVQPSTAEAEVGNPERQALGAQLAVVAAAAGAAGGKSSTSRRRHVFQAVFVKHI
jgi:hypothetical protein